MKQITIKTIDELYELKVLLDRHNFLSRRLIDWLFDTLTNDYSDDFMYFSDCLEVCLDDIHDVSCRLGQVLDNIHPACEQ